MSLSLFSRFTACGLLFALALIVAGCDELDQAAGKGPPPKPGLSPVSQQFLPLDDPATAPKPKPPANPNATASAPAPANSNSPDANPPAANPPSSINQPPVAGNGSVMERAEAGMGVQGQGYGGGIVTEPVSQYFNQRDRITFDIQIPKQMQLWKAEHNNRNPRDAKEYIKEILEPCGIDLPELPPGKTYYYNAKSGELEVGPLKK